MDEAESRLRRLVRTFVGDYLPPLIGLLADTGVEKLEQAKRVDRLVRSLLGAQLESNLTHQGRRLVVEIDDSDDPPVVTFNEQFVDSVDADEAMGLFEKPAADILGVSPLLVGVILELEQGDSLNNLTNRARRGSGAPPIGLAEVPAVVESRLHLLVHRLDRFVSLFTDGLELDADIREGVQAVVSADETAWPGWESVNSSGFVADILEKLDIQVEAEALPEPETVVELCWESLDLSPQSFLRHAARRLRADRNDRLSLENVLRRLAETTEQPDDPIEEAADQWDTFEDLAEAWAGLFRAEQRTLGWSVVRRPTPDLSVFEPPRSSLHMNEPESLPWKVPLLCWSVREQNALRDLLEGHRKTVSNKLDRSDDADCVFVPDPAAPPFVTDDGSGDFSVVVEASPPTPSSGDRERMDRAARACWARLVAQFDRQPEPGQHRILQTIRSSYDGYFEQGTDVWDRRFQAWEELPPEYALALMSEELTNILGGRALFEPFQSPKSTEPRQVPTFVFLAAFEEDAKVGHIRVPLVALKSSFEEAPARIRALEVPDDASSRCRWVGDREVTMRHLVELPNDTVLRNIRNDEVGLQLKR